MKLCTIVFWLPVDSLHQLLGRLRGQVHEHFWRGAKQQGRLVIGLVDLLLLLLLLLYMLLQLLLLQLLLLLPHQFQRGAVQGKVAQSVGQYAGLAVFQFK